MRTVLSDYDRRILESSPGRGVPELRQALAAYLLRSRGLELSPEQIVIGSGAEYLYGLLVQLLGRETGFALEDPCYEKIRRVYEANGARCEALALGPDGIESEALRRCRAGVLHVTPFHSYPSGVTASAAKRHEYAAWARERGAVIVEDDYDAELASPTRQIETIFSLAPERVIYLNTFSKILAPAMRTGFLVLPEALNEQYRARLEFYSCTVPVYDQYVLAAFLEGGHLERYINRRRRQLRRQREE
jgi:GntR family transcriptional regulator/MocR family aminotransferase